MSSPSLPLSWETLRRQLAETELLQERELTAIRESEPELNDGESLLELLIQRKKLTNFQAKEILSGRIELLVLGEYVLLNELGEGGMGVVYRARHRRMERIVALKRMRPEILNNAAARERFQREAIAAGRLVHPNIVAAYDAGEARGLHYLVMEYVEGDDLASYVRREGPIPLEQTLEIIQQAAEGLRYAHRQGVIHRDVKPANFLLDHQGAVKILDMGLARMNTQALSPAEDETVTLTGATNPDGVMGTIAYMPPEQAFDPHNVDERADIYSLGCTLFYLLTGSTPFQGATAWQTLLAHREEPPASLGEVLPETPPAVERLYQSMVAKQPEQRPASMEDVAQRLKAIIAGEDLEPEQELTIPHPAAVERTADELAPPVPQPEPKPPIPDKQLQQRRIIAAVIAVILLAAIVWFAWPKPLPPPMIQSPMGSAQARKIQQDYANYLGAKVVEEFRIGDHTLRMVLIPPGEFHQGRGGAMGQERRVRITKPFYLSETEVTYGVFNEFVADSQRDMSQTLRYTLRKEGWRQEGEWGDLGLNDPPRGDDLPAVSITYWDAVDFCEWLTRKVGRGEFKPPTEAQWEHACRAGSDYRYFFGGGFGRLDEYAWFQSNSEGQIKRVKQRKPNPFGLYDILGNESEWCSDYYLEYSSIWSQPGNSVLIDPDNSDQLRVSGLPGLKPGWDGSRVQRGGKFSGEPQDLQSNARVGHSVDQPIGALRVMWTGDFQP